MDIREVPAKSLLRKQKHIDSWFLSRYNFNLYRGCSHNCAYCDGRDEKYQVDGEFGQCVTVKPNAPELLQRALDPRHKRKPLNPGYILVGGGVGDSYQPLESQYQLTRKSLEILLDFPFPAHLLTKSCLIERDLDLIQQLHQKNGVLVSFSFSTVNDAIAKTLEPGCSLPSQRLATIQRFHDQQLPCGAFLMPVIPYITDSYSNLDQSLRQIQEAGADFVIFGGLTLKEGRQKQHFYRVLETHFPGLLRQYQRLYPGDPYGNAHRNYYQQLNQRFWKAAQQNHVATRIPKKFYENILDKKDKIIVMLAHMDYWLRHAGQESGYGRAAYALMQQETSLQESQDWRHWRGLNTASQKIIEEILATGTAKEFERLAQFQRG